MKTITIEELEALKDAEKTIVDIRPQDQYMRGTFPGAVSLPASRLEEQYEEETARLDKMHPVYVMCHTGEKSQEYLRSPYSAHPRTHLDRNRISPENPDFPL